MSKFLFFGDSITDAGRHRDIDFNQTSYGFGFVRSLVGILHKEDTKHVIYNRGISGDRVVNLYSRAKPDLWNIEPEILTILIGVNDVWHELNANGVEIDRFEKVYRMLLEETLQRLPNIKIMLIEPFFLKGSATIENYEHFLKVYDYAKVVEKLASEFNLPLVKVQDKFDELAKLNGEEIYLYDGVHPNIAGADVIADEWYKVYCQKVK